MSKESNNRFSIGNVHLNLGVVALALDKLDETRDHFGATLRIAHEIDSILLGLGAVGGMARLEAYQGNDERALELIGLVTTHPATSPDLQEMTTRDILDHLHARVSPERYEAALERGKKLDLETVKAELFGRG